MRIPRNAVYAVKVSQNKSEIKLHFSIRKKWQDSDILPLLIMPKSFHFLKFELCAFNNPSWE